MDQTRLGVWAQLTGNIAIVVGLAIVIYELNQNKELAYAQMFEQGHSEFDNQFLATQGDDPRRTFFKAEFCAEQLTGADVVTLSAYYERYVSSWQRIYRTNRIADLDRPWRAVIRKDVRTVFSGEVARRWLKAFLVGSEKLNMAEEMEIYIEQALLEPAVNRQRILYASILPENAISSVCRV
jgi:hypothetical protein